MQQTIKIIAAHALCTGVAATNDSAGTLQIANDVDPRTLALAGVQRIELHFPRFTDGRAYSQAVLLRRAGFAGDIRATGDVLLDQLVAMQRSGFSSAVLRADQDIGAVARQFKRFAGFYQDREHPRTP